MHLHTLSAHIFYQASENAVTYPTASLADWCTSRSDHEADGFAWYRAGEGSFEKAAATVTPERLPLVQLFIVVRVLQVIALFMSPLNRFIDYLVYTKPTLHEDTWLSRFPAKKILFGDNPNHESKRALNFRSATIWAKETMAIKSDLLNKQKIIGNYQKAI